MDNFARCFAFTLGAEGGYTDDSADPGNWTGGEVGHGLLRGTKLGISAAAYPQLDIANLTEAMAEEIYRRDFWAPLQGDALPLPVALVAFDAAVNAGRRRAITWLQQAAGLELGWRFRGGHIGGAEQRGCRATRPRSPGAAAGFLLPPADLAEFRPRLVPASDRAGGGTRGLSLCVQRFDQCFGFVAVQPQCAACDLLGEPAARHRRQDFLLRRIPERSRAPPPQIGAGRRQLALRVFLDDSPRHPFGCEMRQGRAAGFAGTDQPLGAGGGEGVVIHDPSLLQPRENPRYRGLCLPCGGRDLLCLPTFLSAQPGPAVNFPCQHACQPGLGRRIARQMVQRSFI